MLEKGDLEATASQDGNVVLIPDANALLTLAGHFPNIRTIHELSTLVERGDVRLIVPAVVSDAFNREKTSAARRLWRQRRTAVRDMRYLADLTPNTDVLRDLADEIDAAIEAHESSTPATIAAMERILSKAQRVETASDHLARAALRLQQRRPPAQTIKTGTINDCIIWEMVLDALDSGASLIFVTDDGAFFDAERTALNSTLISEIGEARARLEICTLEQFRDRHTSGADLIEPPDEFPELPKRCHAGHPLDGAHVSRVYEYGGWSFYILCEECGFWTDVSELMRE